MPPPESGRQAEQLGPWPAREHVSPPSFWRIWRVDLQAHPFDFKWFVFPVAALLLAAVLPARRWPDVYLWLFLAGGSLVAFWIWWRFRQRVLRIRRAFQEGAVVRAQLVQAHRLLPGVPVVLRISIDSHIYAAEAQMLSTAQHRRVLAEQACWVVFHPEDPQRAYAVESYGCTLSATLRALVEGQFGR